MATEATLNIVGVDCRHCAWHLEQALGRAEGVIEAQVDPIGTATVRFDETRIDEGRLSERVHAAGFDVSS